MTPERYVLAYNTAFPLTKQHKHLLLLTSNWERVFHFTRMKIRVQIFRSTWNVTSCAARWPISFATINYALVYIEIFIFTFRFNGFCYHFSRVFHLHTGDESVSSRHSYVLSSQWHHNPTKECKQWLYVIHCLLLNKIWKFLFLLALLAKHNDRMVIAVQHVRMWIDAQLWASVWRQRINAYMYCDKIKLKDFDEILCLSWSRSLTNCTLRDRWTWVNVYGAWHLPMRVRFHPDRIDFRRFLISCHLTLLCFSFLFPSSKMQARSLALPLSQENPLWISWHDTAWIAVLNPSNVMEYFMEKSNPFYDRTCNNEIVKMQRQSFEQLKYDIEHGLHGLISLKRNNN